MEITENKYLNRFLSSNFRDSSSSVDDSYFMNNLKSNYKRKFLCGKEEYDTLYDLWEICGLSSFNKGLFSFVNPIEYTPVAQKFNTVTQEALVFAKTCMGGLFILDYLPNGKTILYLNVHKNEIKVVSTDFDVFIGHSINIEPFWTKDCYGKFELKVIDKFGPLEYDECYAFEPALALGGSESIKNIKKVKVKEHLEILAQLH